MKQISKTIINGSVYTFEQHYEASDGCKVVIDVERCEDDWARDAKPGQTYEAFKQERLQALEAHPHQLPRKGAR